MHYMRPILLLVAAAAIMSGIYLLSASNQRIRQQAEGFVTVTGYLDGEHTLVTAKVAGRVKWLPVREGDCLTKGQVVAELFEEQGSAQADLVITAPSDGVVVTKLAKEGDLLQAGWPIIDLADTGSLFSQAAVPETLKGKLRVGLAARVSVEGVPDQVIAATLGEVASNVGVAPLGGQPSTEPGKPLYAVKIYLERQPNLCLTPGQAATAVIRWKEGAKWPKPHV
ncbi:MAG: HlyD family efflux transporter periplasmic adaptor subunit [Solidesulfovibrio sp.]